MKITIIGCGNMGLIYARAFLKNNSVSKGNLLLAEKSEIRKQELLQLDIGRVTVLNDPEIGDSDIVLIAVKPQDFSQLAVGLKSILKSVKCIISIMAGMKISRIEIALNNFNIIRTMPNLSVELGFGVTGFTSSRSLPVEQVRIAEDLLATTGITILFEDEKLLDAVTALSGSGPAYFFYIMKHMIEAGNKMGFDVTTSAMLVKQTMLGSYHTVCRSDKPLDDLIKAVTSKGGTTEAALSVFNKMAVGENLQLGIIKAKNRAGELSS